MNLLINLLALGATLLVASVCLVQCHVPPPIDSSRPTAIRQQWRVIKDSLRTNKESMCSFLLNEIDTEESPLNLDKVTNVFENALDHLAKASEYIAKMRPFVDKQVIANFDNNGGIFVLELSNARRDLIEQYEDAEAKGSSDTEKREILETYFYKACASKLGTILAEKSMYDSLVKVERSLRSKLDGADQVKG